MILLENEVQRGNLLQCITATARGLGFDGSDASYQNASVLVELRRAVEAARVNASAAGDTAIALARYERARAVLGGVVEILRKKALTPEERVALVVAESYTREPDCDAVLTPSTGEIYVMEEPAAEGDDSLGVPP